MYSVTIPPGKKINGLRILRFILYFYSGTLCLFRGRTSVALPACTSLPVQYRYKTTGTVHLVRESTARHGQVQGVTHRVCE